MSVQGVITRPKPRQKSISVCRVGVICDFREENWPSMDLVADMLLENLQSGFPQRVEAARIQPIMQSGFSKVSSSSLARTTDRFMGRMRQYPRYVRQLREFYDLFHLVDHSYAHLVNGLPAGRAVVTCHDLDTFRCLLEPETEKRSFAFRRMTERILNGLKSAAWVACASESTRTELTKHEIVPPSRSSVVHNGVHPVYGPEADPMSDAQAAGLLGRRVGQRIEILHVGSVIRRKRIDVLLRVFAEIRQHLPNSRLVRVGDDFTSEQNQLLRKLKLENSVDLIPRAAPRTLAALYRRATLLLQTSDAEGFGLPVVEAMACGTPVIASGIPSLMEVGSDAALYCGVAAIDEWVSAACNLIAERADESRRKARRQKILQNATRFSWQEHARQMVEIYERVRSC